MRVVPQAVVTRMVLNVTVRTEVVVMVETGTMGTESPVWTL